MARQDPKQLTFDDAEVLVAPKRAAQLLDVSRSEIEVRDGQSCNSIQRSCAEVDRWKLILRQTFVAAFVQRCGQSRTRTRRTVLNRVQIAIIYRSGRTVYITLPEPLHAPLPATTDHLLG